MALDGNQGDDRMSTVEVGKGLYVLRYSAGAEAPITSPIAFVRQSPGSESFVRIVSPPGQSSGLLGSPGACVVILAEEAGQVQITVRQRGLNGSWKAKFQLEPLHQEAEPLRKGEVVSGPGSTQNLSIVAHVSRRGDVEVADGDWVGGPNAPAPIEALELRCRIRDLDVEAQVHVAGEWSQWRSSGGFLGTRGRSLPLTGLRMRLIGPASNRYSIESDGLFLGSPIVSKQGSSIELGSQAGGDPLIGLRLHLRAVETASLDPPHLSDPVRAPRVRVFRAAS